VENQVPPTLTTIIPSALPFQPPLFWERGFIDISIGKTGPLRHHNAYDGWLACTCNRTSCNRNGAGTAGRYSRRCRGVFTSRASHWNTHEFRSRLRCPPVFPSTVPEISERSFARTGTSWCGDSTFNKYNSTQ
jgi:hypothetical protein